MREKFFYIIIYLGISTLQLVCALEYVIDEEDRPPCSTFVNNCSAPEELYSYPKSAPQNGRELIKRFVDPTFRGNPKTLTEVWHRNFNSTVKFFDQSYSLVNLLIKIITRYLDACVPVVLYDNFVMDSESFIVQKLLQDFPTTFVHGRIGKNYEIENKDILNSKDSTCRSYIIFLQDSLMTRRVIGPQTTNRVVVVPRSTQWKLQEFLSSPESSDIINLLVIGESFSIDKTKERPYVLYTHQLYSDGLGSNKPIVLTSWLRSRLSRPHVNLFPIKFEKGFSGHRFLVTAANQPPFVFRRRVTNSVGNDEIMWEGIELRLLTAFSRMLNFSIEIIEPRNLNLGPGDAVVSEIIAGRGDIGIGGAYATADRIKKTDISVAHSTDCAAFITLTSKALPRYRAIMGPFQWPVWVALTAAYLFAIFPLAFSDKLTLHHLLGNAGEIENMFWYVFGTFTNSLTFTGENSWSNTTKTSTRLLIGTYWVFTIIITACYTGSIIAFVTLPVFPETVDTIDQLIRGFYRVGTLDRGGWEQWFGNSSHTKTAKLFKNLEYVANMEEGLNNVTKAFFWSYAFFSSKAHLEYIAQSNFSANVIGKRSALHISNQCFTFFGVSFVYPKNSVYLERLNDAILRFQSSGLMEKVAGDVSWSMQRSSNGRLLQATKGSTRTLQQDERGLTLADTEGMFLLLGMGFVLAGSVLLSEWVGGCTNRCRAILKKRRDDRLAEEAANDEHSFLPNSSRSRPSSILSGTPGDDISSKTDSQLSGDDASGKYKTNRGHNRSQSMIEANLNEETLQELYNGPERRHSSFVYFNGELIPESEMIRQVHSANDNSNHMVTFLEDPEEREKFNEQLLTVEINRPATPYVHPDIEEVFGESVEEIN